MSHVGPAVTNLISAPPDAPAGFVAVSPSDGTPANPVVLGRCPGGDDVLDRDVDGAVDPVDRV
ncbi:MAG: hypothetical protein WD942_03035, partial [Dehalococcoidia bacterium]